MTERRPNLVPLVILVILDGILALISVPTIAHLLETKTTVQSQQNSIYLALSLLFLGDFLFAGYVVSLISRKFNPFFWGFSLVINLILCVFYFLYLVSGVFFLILLVVWCGFVSAASAYYLNFRLSNQNSALR